MVCLFIEGAPARPCQWDHWDGDATGWTHWPRAPPRPLRNAARLATYKLWFPSYNNNDPVLCWQWPEQRHARPSSTRRSCDPLSWEQLTLRPGCLGLGPTST